MTTRNCSNNPSPAGGDRLEASHDRQSSYTSANAWLIQHGIRYLHSAAKEAEVGYKYVIELLLRNEAAESVVQLLRTVPQNDVPLRWSLLYLLGDIGDKRVGQWLEQFSIQPLPPREEGCEGPRDAELLLRTMAIESLKRIAPRHPEAGDYLVKLISHRPDRAVLVEAVKAAVELGLRQKVVEVLTKEDHWILDIRKARAEELHADPERADTKERSFTPPNILSFTTPSTHCGCRKGGLHHG